MHTRSRLVRRPCHPRPASCFGRDTVDAFGLIAAIDANVRGICRRRLQVGADASLSADAPAIARSHAIGGKICLSRMIVATVAITMISAPITTKFASSAYVESNHVSAAHLADRYQAFVVEASRRFEVPASWLQAAMPAESRGDVHAVSSKGAMGLVQIMPTTWSPRNKAHSPDHAASRT